jgi:Na+/H+-dicarboxylate symporter
MPGTQAPFILLAILGGAAAGLWGGEPVLALANIVSDLFIRLLRLVSLPVISFSLLSTLSGMGQRAALQTLGRRVILYTLLTTLISAAVALILYSVINPALPTVTSGEALPTQAKGSYVEALLNSVPSNIIQPFVEHNVMGVLFITVLFSIAIMLLPDEQRLPLHNVLEGLFRAVMLIIRGIVRLMPLAVWAFITLFCQDLQKGLPLGELGAYLAVIVGANLIQALMVLPAFLRYHRIKPWDALKAFYPALSFAFLSKSSTAAMPVALDCAQRYGVPAPIARFCYPLCTTINMNACAAFILTTVLFVGSYGGLTFTVFDKVMWVVLATLAAVGNAGVPMGCFFLASALLTTMGAPITLMGVILPFYAVIDMLESAINIWSDSCVTLMVSAGEEAA